VTNLANAVLMSHVCRNTNEIQDIGRLKKRRKDISRVKFRKKTEDERWFMKRKK